jgi:hypothetical protein
LPAVIIRSAKFVDHHHDLRQDLVIELLGLIDGLAPSRVIAGPDLAPELGAARLRLQHLVVEALERAHAEAAIMR